MEKELQKVIYDCDCTESCKKKSVLYMVHYKGGEWYRIFFKNHIENEEVRLLGVFSNNTHLAFQKLFNQVEFNSNDFTEDELEQTK